MEKFNLANFLKDAPTGLPLWSKLLGHEVAFIEVTKYNRIICLDQYNEGHSNEVYFDEFGGMIGATAEVDLMPDDYNVWDNYGICALISENSMCIGKVLMDKFDPDSDAEYPWIIGNTAMWSFDHVWELPWECVRFHKFDFSYVWFATEQETKEYFETMHECGLDFKDGTPINNGEDAELECRNANKEQFLNALTEVCEAWKGTIPEHDFHEVLFKFDTEVIFPKLKKAFGWDSEIIKDSEELV